MSKKEHIDQLFKNSFDQFEATPSPEVWNRIQAELKEEKDDRKVIPLWWKLGGVAALLALLLTVGNSLFVIDTPTDIVTEDASNEMLHDSDGKNDSTPFKNPDNSEIVVTEDGSFEKTEDQIQLKKENSRTEITTGSYKSEQSLTKSNTSERNSKTLQNKATPLSITKETTGVADVNTKENALPSSQRNPLIKDSGLNPNSEASENGVTKTKDPISKKTEEANKTLGQSKITGSEIAKENNVDEAKQEVEETLNKRSIFDAIEENQEEAVAQQDQKRQGNWEVTPNVGPVYYNSLGGGSSIDPSFADNSQTGEVNFSYGVQVAYEVTNRLSIRSGVNNVNVGYATGGVELASGPASFGLKTVDYANPNRNVLSAFDKGTIPSVPTDPNNPYGQLNLKSTSGNAEIRQSITYYEVPLEAKYVLVNRRFGVNMIGGFSTLFLGDSEISVNDTNFRSVLGEANNLNDVSFSTNIGLGFDYKISEKFKFNIEPMFKYQLNPYTDASVDFRPYYFGVYSGLSFKF